MAGHFCAFLQPRLYGLYCQMHTPSDTPLDPPEEPELPFAAPLSRTEQPLLPDEENPFVFDHVHLRFRHDGWTPERQERFIEALAATGCVEHAARAVGKSVSSAYALKIRAEAKSFRMAWEAALEVGISRLSEAALSRAIYGVAQPVFYQGEQVGERRHYDERLTMFLLRYRDPARYGPWLDRVESIEEKPDGAPLLLRRMLNQLMDRLFGAEPDTPTPRPPASPSLQDAGDSDETDEDEDEDGWDGAVDDDTGQAPENAGEQPVLGHSEDGQRTDWGAEAERADPDSLPQPRIRGF